MEDFYLYLQEILHVDRLTIHSKNYDLVLDIMVTNDERISWSYYYACHDTRCLFWLEDYDPSYMVSELEGVESPAHVSTSQSPASSHVFPLISCTEHRLEALYWYISYLLLDSFLS